MISTSDILRAQVLIVDDQETNVLLLQRTLLGAGYSAVVATTDPRRVCELHRRQRFDLIILDINMPGMDGFQVMECLRKADADNYPPVLVITAEPGHKQRALQAGAKDFLSKPLELVEVVTRVHNMLEAHLLQREAADHRDDNPALSSIIHRNIRKIIQLRLKSMREKSVEGRIADAITLFSGSMNFLYLHIVWFSGWVLLNTGRIGMHPFDPYPYPLLTMVVSLEAIFLATFVLISQNLLSKEAERIAELGLQTGLLTEHELTRALQMLHAIQTKVGISNDEENDLADADLEMETNPEDVLAEIARLHLRAEGDRRHR